MVKSLICVVCLTSLRSQRRADINLLCITFKLGSVSSSRSLAHSSLNPFRLAIFKFSSSPPSSPYVVVIFIFPFVVFAHSRGSFPRMARLFFPHWVLTLHRGFDAPTWLSLLFFRYFSFVLLLSLCLHTTSSNCISHSFASTNIVTGAVSRLCIRLKAESCHGSAFA
jgi:hypothetical protein